MAEYNFDVLSGTSRRLKTGGKYCADDILVHGTVPEMEYPAEPSDVSSGVSYIDENGQVQYGILDITGVYSQDDGDFIPVEKITIMGDHYLRMTRAASSAMVYKVTLNIMDGYNYRISCNGVTSTVGLNDHPGYIEVVGPQAIIVENDSAITGLGGGCVFNWQLASQVNTRLIFDVNGDDSRGSLTLGLWVP